MQTQLTAGASSRSGSGGISFWLISSACFLQRNMLAIMKNCCSSSFSFHCRGLINKTDLSRTVKNTPHSVETISVEFAYFSFPPLFFPLVKVHEETFADSNTFPKLPVKITSTHHPMDRHHTDETPSLWSRHSHFQECSRYAEHCLKTMPKHLQSSALFTALLPLSQKPMSQLMLTGRRGGGKGWAIHFPRWSQQSSQKIPLPRTFSFW